MKIAISGKSGCGNTSVSTIISKNLNLTLINYTFKDLAKDKGLPFDEMCLLAEKDKQYDLFLDQRLVELSKGGNCVLGSRLAIWLLKDADFKIYLEASVEARAKRIALRENLTVDLSIEKTIKRDDRDRNRYLRLYNIDNDLYQFADFIINTEEGDSLYVANLIMEKIRNKLK